MKKIMSKVMAVALAGVMLVGCGGAGSAISVVSREEGSGTRGAFIELFGIEEKDASGNKVDNTTQEAITIQSTSVMMTTVAGDVNGIGYVSLGSLNDSVKAAQIDGVDATVENIKSGKYTISRPFNIVTKSEVSDAAKDFIAFILSTQGQNVVEENSHIPNDGAQDYQASGIKGKVVVAGSSSVTPVMEKLKEAYVALNPDVSIEVQQSDSSTGVTAAIDGTADIGMASRELKDTETSQGVAPTVIATDGIAVIINKENEKTNLTKDQVKKIYTSEITDWDELGE